MSSTATTSSSIVTDVIAAALAQHELAVRSRHGIEVPVPDHVLPQAVELRDQVAAAEKINQSYLCRTPQARPAELSTRAVTLVDRAIHLENSL
jgi:hypothetical protein